MEEISKRERRGGLKEIGFFEISQTSAVEGGVLWILVAVRKRQWWRILQVVCRERERENTWVWVLKNSVSIFFLKINK